MDLRSKLAAQGEAVIGRHDEPEIYDGPAGDRGLAGGPGSISWEINGDLASLAVAGSGAILMEVLHPSVMHGVFTQSSYRTQPEQRIRNTLGYVLRTTFGSTDGATAVIERVKRMHGRVRGVRADGVAYAALDPELIAWVHTCIPWTVMTAYDRYRRPLESDEKDRYLREQAVIGRMGGADWVPESVAELDDYVESMRPKLAMNEQTVEFVDFMTGRSGDYPTTARDRVDLRLNLVASMSLLPRWAQALTATTQPELVRRVALDPFNRLRSGIVRWTFPELPCVTRATARATATSATANAA